jgi:hypothetical protein
MPRLPKPLLKNPPHNLDTMPLVIALTLLCLLLGGFDWLSEQWEEREARKRRKAWAEEQRRQRLR